MKEVSEFEHAGQLIADHKLEYILLLSEILNTYRHSNRNFGT